MASLPTRADEDQTPILSDQQLVASRLAADGYSIEEIAEQMGVAKRTAKHYLDVARWKLGVKHKRHLGRKLKELGLDE